MRCEKITEEQEQEIISSFLNERISLNKLAQRYKRNSKDFIYNILNKYGIDKKRRHIANTFTEIEEMEIIKQYNNGDTMRCIAKKYNVNLEIIKRVMLSHGIYIRKHYKNTFNEDYFDIIDTHNKAYLLGFLYADGCIEKNNMVSIVVHQKDIEILEMFQNELEATNKIIYIKSKPHVRINFCSKHMCDSLIKIGCCHNKTYNLRFPNICKNFLYDFIRGFMDGDGCISITDRIHHKYISLSFTGTFDMMKSLKNIFQVDNVISKYRNAYALHIGKASDVLRILDSIYANSNLYMTRKYNKYKEYINWIQTKEVEYDT